MIPHRPSLDVRLSLPDPIAALPAGRVEVGEAAPAIVGATWSELVAGDDAAVAETETETVEGWPLALVRAEHPDGPRLHAFFCVIDHVIHVRIAGPAGDLDGAGELLRAATIVWPTCEVVALAQLWDGL
jgi:hypothetical protein